MKRNGAGPGNGSADGTGGAAGGVINLAHLKAEIERLRTLKAEGIEEVEYEFELGQAAKLFGIGKRKFRQFVEGPPTGSANRSGGQALPASIEEANRFVDGVKPELTVRTDDLPAAADAVRDLFAAAGDVFEWNVPAKVVRSDDRTLPLISPFAVENVVNEVHRLCRPIQVTPGGKRMAITLPDRVARLYLAKKADWRLPRLAGITTTPMLREDGSIRTAEGYDQETRLWCVNVPTLTIPERPSQDQAREALQRLRRPFRTFPFADAETVWDEKLKLELVDLLKDPGRDESAFLTSLLTSVCRPCLHLAPGVMLVGAQISGAGSGKGLLGGAICLIAFGLRPAAFTVGKGEEPEKRIASDLLEGDPFVLENGEEAAAQQLGDRAATPLLAELLSLPRPAGNPLVALSPHQHKARMLGALVDYFVALVRLQPLVMLLEDAHWIDPTTRDLVDALLARIEQVPVLLVVTTRPGFALFAGGDRVCTEQMMHRLEPTEADRLLRQVVGDKRLPPELAEEVLVRTDGIPLFIELRSNSLWMGKLRLKMKLRQYSIWAIA
jgi:hypothetical protein